MTADCRREEAQLDAPGLSRLPAWPRSATLLDRFLVGKVVSDSSAHWLSERSAIFFLLKVTDDATGQVKGTFLRFCTVYFVGQDTCIRRKMPMEWHGLCLRRFQVLSYALSDSMYNMSCWLSFQGNQRHCGQKVCFEMSVDTITNAFPIIPLLLELKKEEDHFLSFSKLKNMRIQFDKPNLFFVFWQKPIGFISKNCMHSDSLILL